MNSGLDVTADHSRAQRLWWAGLLAATAANCVLQIAWFWRFRAHNINFDGINYIGLARHLVDGNFKASLHGYLSPLVSWLIAAASFFAGDFTFAGRLVTIATFLACLPLIYLLTKQLWNSRTAAALAVFWFSTARGILQESIASVLADFLLTACVLAYFGLLVRALRSDQSRDWLWVGAAHALAFLAKAIAMPWLAIATVGAVVLKHARAPRKLAASLLLAFVIPAAVWTAWGFTLRTKYGVFTAGYQLRQNLLVNWTRKQSHYARGDNLAFVDTSSLYDEYMVGETAWTQLQSFQMWRPAILAMLLGAERENLPAAAKETVILLNPGGVVALATVLLLLASRWRSDAESVFAAIAVLSTLSLVAAYCMLVFDTRYVIPIIPVLMAIASPALLPANWTPQVPAVTKWLHTSALVFWIASTIFFALYWASPFRTVDRDFEVSCYRAADVLRSAKPHGTLVSIGNGPYPEHGVGFEAAPYTAYFSGWRLVAGNSELPGINAPTSLVDKVVGTSADASAVWGSPTNPAYTRIVESIGKKLLSATSTQITDPSKGEVGTIFLTRDSR